MNFKNTIIAGITIGILINPTAVRASEINITPTPTAIEITDNNNKVETDIITEIITPTTTKKTYATKFTDVTSKTTNYKYIKYLTDAGALGGYKDGKFKPATKMTNSKYICILVRAIDPKAPRATKGNDYDVKTMNYAAKIGLFKENELKPENYSKTLTFGNFFIQLQINKLNKSTHSMCADK